MVSVDSVSQSGMGSRRVLAHAAAPQELLPVKRFQLLRHAVRRGHGLALDGAVGIDHDPSDGAGQAKQNDGNQPRNEMQQVHADLYCCLGIEPCTNVLQNEWPVEISGFLPRQGHMARHRGCRTHRRQATNPARTPSPTLRQSIEIKGMGVEAAAQTVVLHVAGEYWPM